VIGTLKEISYALILLCPVVALPLTISKGITAPWRLIFFLWGVMILSMIFGVPGKASVLLLLNVMELPSLPDKQQLFGMGLISSWGSSYPLFFILRRRVTLFKENYLIPNLLFMFAYFYGLHLCFAALGILLVKTFT
jgi:hypothetical protein